MTENPGRGRWLWPAAFLLLNLGAIVGWFAWHAGLSGRELTVVAMTPSGREVDAAGVTEVALTFNLPIDPETVKADTIRLVPPVGGRTELSGKETLRFLPHEPLSSATGYTVILSPGIRGSRGEPPPRDLLEFSTTRFRLEASSQIAFDRHSHTIELVFNQPIAASELERAIQVRTSPSSRGQDSPISVQGNANSRTQRVRINRYRSGHVLLTLPAGLTGSSGPLGLEDDERLLWRIVGPEDGGEARAPDWAGGLTAKDLRQEVAFLGMTAEWDDGVGVVRVRTTAPFDLERAGQYVDVSPQVPVTFASTWNGLKIMGDFQPGRQYRITLAKGMPAGYAGSLDRDISRQVWFDDLPPSLSFAYGGGFLSPHGMLKVPVSARNMPEFVLGMRKLYASNLIEALLREYDEEVDEEYAEPEIKKTIRTGGSRNKEKEILLDLRELTGGEPLGVYGLQVWNAERRWNTRNALVAVSDLGLSCRQGRNAMLAWATSIREGTPRSGVKVSLYSNKRQLLAEGESGSDGVARLDIPRLAKGETPAILLSDAGGGEYSYVRLDRDMKQRSSATQRGAPYTDAYQVFLSPERGVYRGGETVMLSGLVRDDAVAAVPGLPIDLVLLGPDGKELQRNRVKADEAGRLNHEALLRDSYPGGLYMIEARLPGQEELLGQALFRVADYMPETMSIAMELKEKEKPEDDHTIWIKVSRLAGGDLGETNARVMVSYGPASFEPEGWNGWIFGDSRRNGRAEGRERSVDLDPEGKGETSWRDPSLPFPAAGAMTVRCEVSEAGGRPVTGAVHKEVHGVPFYVGARPPRETARAKQEFPVALALVDPEGGAVDLDTDWSGQLLRIEYNSVMKKNARGGLVHEWVRREIPEAKLSGIWKDGRSEARPMPLAGGSYRMVVETDGGRACVVDFSVDGAGASWHGEDPETLAITFDREQYRVGDRATATTLAPFAGMALIMVETDEVLSHWLMEFKRGENTFVVPVNENMRPNAYVSATMVRPAQAEAEWKPHRLSGAAPLRVDNTDRRLLVELTAPEAFQPGKDARVTIKATLDGKPAANAVVALWAVDVGVLSLTDFRAASPWEAYYQTRRSGIREADMYSRLAPELLRWQAGGEASPGGDASDGLARRLNPVFASRVKPVVLFEKGLATDEKGEAEADLAIPQFAGRLRLMCWVADGKDMGHTEKEVEVKAPLSVAATWPRFAAPGDEFVVPVTVINRSGRDGAALVVCAGDDQIEFELKNMAVEIGRDQSRRILLNARAKQAGTAKLSVTATMDGDSFTDRVEMAVRPPVLFAREAGSFSVAPGATVEFTLADQLLAKNSRVKLMAGGSPQIALTGSMDALLDYPYGCAEQTASRLLALVFLPDLVSLSRPGQLESGEIDLLATACIERLSTMQSANGSLKTWPQGGGELFWVSAQALFSLVESRAAGHAIPDGLINNLCSYLDNRLESAIEDEAFADDNGESVALALLSMAKADRLKRSWLIRLEEIAESRAKEGRPVASAALAFMCEAVALAGDREGARQLFSRFNPRGETPGQAGAQPVDLAAWLMAAMAVGDDGAVDHAAELSHLCREGFTTWSTRENSLVLAALGRYWQNREPVPDASASIAMNGRTTAFSTRRGGSWDKLSAGTRVKIVNPSSGALKLFWLAEGLPLSGKAVEEDRGLAARRKVFSSSGREVAGPYELKQGEVYEIRLSLRGDAKDLVLVDLLPAGLEIEDATLKGRALAKESSAGLSVGQVERKDDRLLVFGSLSGEGEYRYLVRAVTGGSFVWPALDAGRMYNAAVRSVNGSGQVKITGGKEAANDR